MQMYITAEARESLRYFKEKYPDVLKRIKNMFETMESMRDPRQLSNCESMTGNMKGSYRVAIYKPLSIRILFVITKDGVEIGEFQRIEGNPEDYQCEVFRVGKRGRVYEQPHCKQDLEKVRRVHRG